VIAELQNKWRCEYHSKGKDLYCYVDPSNGLCYGLSHQDFGFWANRVVRVSLSSVFATGIVYETTICLAWQGHNRKREAIKAYSS
jgi:hypothetical protein